MLLPSALWPFLNKRRLQSKQHLNTYTLKETIPRQKSGEVGKSATRFVIKASLAVLPHPCGRHEGR